MATEPTRLRYRADRPDVYAEAILALVEHARDSSDDFTFGPLRLADCVRSGLELMGPDLTDAIVILSAIPGIDQADA